MSAASSAISGLPVWNPLDPDFRADPYRLYARLRTEAPVSRTDQDTLVVARYHDVANTLRSPQFSRDIDANVRERPDPVSQRRRARRAQGSRSILNLDPPDHTRLRRIVTTAFTPTAIERLRPRIQAMVDQRLDSAATQGGMELIEDLAFPVPFLVISELLNMPTGDSDQVRDWSQALTASLEPTASLEVLDQAEAALGGLIPYLIGIIEERRSNLGEDLLSALLIAEDEGDRLTAEELITFVVLLYVAGHETTVNLIGNAMLALLAHPEQLDLWRNDPSLDDNAIDELLRYDGPVQHTVRVPMQPIDYVGVSDQVWTAVPGDLVVTLLGSANRDPEIFTDPDQLILSRPNASRHLAFSAGIHYCLGASLAKLEAKVVLGSLIRRFSEIEMTSQPRWRDRITIRGVERLELTWKSTAG
jgi:cytochrome P450